MATETVIEHDFAAPLHAFELQSKIFIDFGMFFFTLANAGVQLDSIGPLTLTIFMSLVVGKIIFITAIVLVASWCRLAPLHSSIKVPDVGMISAMASIGLTVALFIAGEAFKQEQLKAEAKMGALLSGLMGAICILYAKTPLWPQRMKAPSAAASAAAAADESLHGAERSVQKVQFDEETEDVDDIAYIVANALEQQYMMSRSAILARERKAILTGRSSLINDMCDSAEPTPKDPKARLSNGRRLSWSSTQSQRLPAAKTDVHQLAQV